MKRRLFVIFLFLIPVFFSLSQEEGGGGNPEGAGEISGGEVSSEAAGEAETETELEAEPEDPNAAIINMDIKTSTLMELASWCRSLGLSEGGSRDELANRLRDYYKLPAEGGTISSEAKIITIESARTTEYFTLDIVDEEYARLRGDVVISLKDGEAAHRVKAWEILYNRTRNLLTASGGVEYVKEDGDTIETFKGASIVVNLDNWSSIFMDGVSERSVSGNETAYRFAGTVISRNSEEVTVLTGAEITNATNDEAFWSLNASKLWLLPGSDWAIFNAVLKVGNIPVLYLPFFFYPSDEIVFHPVVGSRSREGTFLQTTTYILGRPKTSGTSENSITKIFGSSADMEKTREGVFLRSTGKKYRDPNDTRLSVLFDAYANLGMYLGTELALPKMGSFGATDLSFGIGFTRNVYQVPYGSSPFANYDGRSEWNSSRLFSFNMPFRYRFKLTGSYSGKYGTLSLDFPHYSDPYVDRDFLNRSETLDWLGMIREGSSKEETTTTDTVMSSYEWRLSGSLSPNVSALSPYLSSLSISSISSSLSFSTRYSSKPGASSSPDPARLFFFPNRFTLYSINVSAAGTPFTLGGGVSRPAGSESQEAAPGDALLPALPRSPWEEAAKPEESSAAGSADGDYSLSPPPLAQRFETGSSGSPKLAFDYRLSPSTATELQFRSSQQNWREAEDIDWSEVSSVLSRIRSDGSIGLSLSQSGNNLAYSNTFRISGTGAWQDYMFLNEDAEEFTTGGAPAPDKIKAARDRAYNETYFTSSWEYGATIQPLYFSPVWKNTNVQYSVRGLLAKTTVDTSGADPDWDLVRGKWTKEDLDTHQVAANIAASVRDYNQNLSITAVLPPEDTSLAGNATFRVWITETNARGRILNPYEEDKRSFEPVYMTETLKFGSLGSFQQYVVYEPEIKEFTTLTSSLSLSSFTASYTAIYDRNYRFEQNSGRYNWVQTGEKKLVPREFRMAYSKTFKKEGLWDKRLSLSLNLNTGLGFDLQRYTNSRYNFSLGFTTGITNFMNITLSTNSENTQIFRYFSGLSFFDDFPQDLYRNQETNLFVDLLNSFRFDDIEMRRQSGFKLKSFSLSLIHYLGDWNASLTMTLSPYLDQTGGPPYSYKFNNQLAFLVQWIPIEEIKTDIRYDKEKLTFE